MTSTLQPSNQESGGAAQAGSRGSAPRQMLKYGVVGLSALLDDLRTWSSLYISGRLHKPVRFLHGGSRLALANLGNLRSAVTASLLLLPRTFGTQVCWLAANPILRCCPKPWEQESSLYYLMHV